TEKATSLAIDTLKVRLATEKDPAVKQDLSILISSAEDNNEAPRLGRKLQLPYLNVSQVVFQGLRALLDDQVPAERRAFALKRLNRYAGLEPGTRPLTTLAMARTRE